MIIINDNLNNLPKQITITFGRVQWVAPKDDEVQRYYVERNKFHAGRWGKNTLYNV